MKTAILFFALVLVNPLMAGQGLDRLEQFSNQLESFSASFEQTVYDANSKPVQESSGSVILKRPGKFAWNYKSPSNQLILADGRKIWIYDEDLAQVTVKPVDASLGSTPIMLLGGDKSLASGFDVRELGESDGIDWLELLPKEKDSDFEKVYLGLNKQGLVAMELRDNFGQATQIKFDDIEMNKPVDDSQFSFTPPEGVDIVGE